MSTMRNSVMLIGRPGAEPEIKTFNNNKKARFSLAVTENKKNSNGEWVNDTQWFPIIAWGPIADRVEKNVKKVKRIAIDGSLKNNEWTDDKGQRHSVTEVWVNDLFLIDFEKE